MAPSPSPESGITLTAEDRAELLDIAQRSIADGLDHRPPTLPATADLSAALRAPVGAFVTLGVNGALNGCIGSIETDRPLAASVARHAWSAAFDDPRLPALRRRDLRHLEIEISILSPLVEVGAHPRAELLRVLRPAIDGLVIESGSRRAVFLPTVWEQLSSPEEFVDHLLRKAGLDQCSWPDDLRAFVFTTETFGRPANRLPQPRLR